MATFHTPCAEELPFDILRSIKSKPTQKEVMKRFSSRLGRLALWIPGALGLLASHLASAAVFDYSATFRDVLLNVEGSTVHYRVFDTALARFVNGEDGSGNISGLSQAD